MVLFYISLRQRNIQTKQTLRQKMLPEIKKRHFIMIRSVHQEDTANVNVYVPNNRTSKYMKYNPLSQQLIKQLDRKVIKL